MYKIFYINILLVLFFIHLPSVSRAEVPFQNDKSIIENTSKMELGIGSSYHTVYYWIYGWKDFTLRESFTMGLFFQNTLSEQDLIYFQEVNNKYDYDQVINKEYFELDNILKMPVYNILSNHKEIAFKKSPNKHIKKLRTSIELDFGIPAEFEISRRKTVYPAVNLGFMVGYAVNEGKYRFVPEIGIRFNFFKQYKKTSSSEYFQNRGKKIISKISYNEKTLEFPIHLMLHENKKIFFFNGTYLFMGVDIICSLTCHLHYRNREIIDNRDYNRIFYRLVIGCYLEFPYGIYWSFKWGLPIDLLKSAKKSRSRHWDSPPSLQELRGSTLHFFDLGIGINIMECIYPIEKYSMKISYIKEK